MHGSSRFQQNRFSSQSLTRTIFKSRSSLIVRENVILNRTVVVDSDSQQSLSTTTVLFRTTFTETIKLNLLLKWLLGSNLSQTTILLTRGLTRDIFAVWAGVRKVASADNRSIFYRACAKFVTRFASNWFVKSAWVSRENYYTYTCELLSSSFCFVFLLRPFWF